MSVCLNILCIRKDSDVSYHCDSLHKLINFVTGRVDLVHTFRGLRPWDEEVCQLAVVENPRGRKEEEGLNQYPLQS